MANVKQSHYLPRAAYLSQFSSDGKIWVYNLAEGKDGFTKSRPFQTTPEKFGKQSRLYEVPGLPENSLENVLQPIEDEYLRLFDQKITKHRELTRPELEMLSLFIATLEVRVPAQKEHWDNQLEGLKQTGIQMALANNSREAAEQFAEQVDQAILGNFATLISTAIAVNRWQFADFCFLYIEHEEVDQFFVTSDHPTSLIDYTSMNTIYGISPTNRTLELTVPLSRNLALFINNAGITGYKRADPNFVRDINNRTVNHAAGYLVAPKELNNYFYKGVYQHYPQSLILRYARLPKGNVDKELERIKKRERKLARCLKIMQIWQKGGCGEN